MKDVMELILLTLALAAICDILGETIKLRESMDSLTKIIKNRRMDELLNKIKEESEDNE